MASWDLKLDSAEEHMQALAQAIEAFIATDPYTVSRKLEDDDAVHVYFFSKYTEPPDDTGLLVGDVVHNLRASLDHIELALAQEGADAVGVAMSQKMERTVQFPIADSSDQFEDLIGRHRLRYVEPEAKAIIERLQPYWIRPGDPERSWIAVVDDLDVTDKHRTIPAMGAVVSYAAFIQPPGIQIPQTLIRVLPLVFCAPRRPARTRP